MLDAIGQLTDLPRQALYNMLGPAVKTARRIGGFSDDKAGLQDLAGMAPGISGALMAALVGPGAGLLAAGGLQGLGNMAAPETFQSASPADLMAGLGIGDPDSALQTSAVSMATNPLSWYAAANAPRALNAARSRFNGPPETPPIDPYAKPPGLAEPDLRNQYASPEQKAPGFAEALQSNPMEADALRAKYMGAAEAQGIDPDLFAYDAMPLTRSSGRIDEAASLALKKQKESYLLRALYGDMEQDMAGGQMVPIEQRLGLADEMRSKISAAAKLRGATGIEAGEDFVPGTTANHTPVVDVQNPIETPVAQQMYDEARQYRDFANKGFLDADPRALEAAGRSMFGDTTGYHYGMPQVTNNAVVRNYNAGVEPILQGLGQNPGIKEVLQRLDQLRAAGYQLNQEAVIKYLMDNGLVNWII